MRLIRKISQLKNMAYFQPDKSWEIKTKYELLSEIASQNRLMQAQKLDYSQKTDLLFSTFLSKFSPSLSKALAGFLIIVMGSGLSLAAQASTPGEMLWPIKRSMEQVELSLTLGPVRETEVHIKHIGKRLEEINKILDKDNNQETGTQAKEKAIKQAVRHLEKDVTAADSSLKIAKEETNPVAVVELVKKVTEATKEVSNVLSAQAKDNIDEDKTIGEALVSAKEVNEVVQKSAVNVAIEVHEEVLEAANKKNIEASTSTNVLNTNDDLNNNLSYQSSTASFINSVKNNSEVDVVELETVTNLVKEIMASEINDTSSEISDVQQKVEDVDQNELQNLETLDIEDIDNVKDSPADDQVLGDARALLEEGFLRDAFNTIYQVKEKYQRADVVLEKIRQAILEHGVVDPELIDELNYQNSAPESSPVSASMIIPDSKETEIIKEEQ